MFVQATDGLAFCYYLGMLKKTESGPAEVEYSDDEGCMIDVYDSTTELTNIVAPDHNQHVPSKFNFDESGKHFVMIGSRTLSVQNLAGGQCLAGPACY
jgi:hypothetical protein